MTAEERKKSNAQIEAMARELKAEKFNDRDRERVWLFSNAILIGLNLYRDLQPTSQQNDFQPA